MFEFVAVMQIYTVKAQLKDLLGTAADEVVCQGSVDESQRRDR